MFWASALILENKKGHFLLMLRENKKIIPYPGYWCFVGGLAKLGETKEETMLREVKEEINFDVKGYKFFRDFMFGFQRVSLFHVKSNYNLNDFELLEEGEDLKFFSFEEIQNLKIIPSHKTMINKFIQACDIQRK